MVIDIKDKGPSNEFGAPSLSSVSVGADESVSAIRSAWPKMPAMRSGSLKASFQSEPVDNISAQDETGIYADQRSVSRLKDRLANESIDPDQFHAGNVARTYLVFNGGKSAQSQPESISDTGPAPEQVQRLVRSDKITFLN